MAGTIGALDNNIGVVGVAPGARLWAVKVLNQNGSGYTSGIIAGIDWTIDHGGIEVLNMSLGGAGISTAYRDAIDKAVANGVVVVVAAGNSDADANNYSPAYVPSAITVSALADFDGIPGGYGTEACRQDIDDTLANFSNWGTAIDIAAPGVCIKSTYPLEQGAYGTISGTSMAAPHVAGAAALLASGANAPLNRDGVEAIRDALVTSGNFDWTDDSGDGIQEPLLDLTAVGAALVSTGDGGGGPQPVPPTAGFSTICTLLSCTFTDQSTDDVGIKGWSWDFGDGSSSNLQNPAHVFTQATTYQVRLTVTDDDALEDTFTQGVTVTDGAGAGGVTLEVTPFKEKGVRHAWLTWAGVTTTDVDIFVDEEISPRETNVLAIEGTTPPGYDFLLDGKGGGNFLIKVCEAGSNTACSAKMPAVY